VKKLLLTSIVVAVAGASFAQSFSNSILSASVIGANASISSMGSTHMADIRGFVLNRGESGSIAWNFDFMSGALPYDQVELIIEGTLQDSDSGPGDAVILGTEQIFDISGPSSVLVGSGLMFEALSGTGLTAFSKSIMIALDPKVSKGHASKDLAFMVNNGTLNVTKVTQKFAPVPEPATMAALGLGLAAAVRRRKK